MPSKSLKVACCQQLSLDPDSLAAELRSADAAVRLRALHRICPCGAGFSLYGRFLREVKRLQKDPDASVRAMALHVERDACEIESIDARLERAAELGRRPGDADWTARKRRRQATGTWEPLRAR